MLNFILGLIGFISDEVSRGQEAEHQAYLYEDEAESLYNPSDEIDSEAEFAAERADLLEQQAQLAIDTATQQAGEYREGAQLSLDESRVEAAGITSRALDVTDESAARTGMMTASAGAGNVGGASVLRQIATTQRRATRQASILGAQGAAVRERGMFNYRTGMQRADLTMRRGELQQESLLSDAAYADWQSQEAIDRAALLQEEAEWLHGVGWDLRLGKRIGDWFRERRYGSGPPGGSPSTGLPGD